MRTVLSLSLILLASAAHADDCRRGFFSKDLCAEAELARGQIAVVLPRTLSAGMIWKNIATSGSRLIGTVVWEMPASTLDERLGAQNKTRQDLADELVGFTSSIVCGQVPFQEFIGAGGVFQFDYTTQDNVKLASVPVTKC